MLLASPPPAHARCPAGLRLLALLAASLCLMSPPRAAAQDTQHWAIQYGPVGQLVGGQVIGGAPALGQDVSVHYSKVTFLLGFVFGV